MSDRFPKARVVNLRQKWRRAHGKRQGWRCAYCDTDIDETPVIGRPHRAATLDHVLPLARGGIDHYENTVTACAACNFAKGPQTGAEYRGWLWFLGALVNANGLDAARDALAALPRSDEAA